MRAEITENKKILYIKELLDMVPVFHLYGLGLDVEKLRGKSRKQEIVLLRAIVCRVLRNKDKSTPEIGSYINRDHATVVHLLNTYEFKNKFDREAANQIIREFSYPQIEEKIAILEKRLEKALDEVCTLRKSILEEKELLKTTKGG